jgi:hypothetical protein
MSLYCDRRCFRKLTKSFRKVQSSVALEPQIAFNQMFCDHHTTLYSTMPRDVALVTSKHRTLVQNVWFACLVFGSYLFQISIKQDRQCTGKVTLRRFVLPFCSGQAISSTHSEFDFVALCILHKLHLHHIVICGLSGSTVFFHMTSLTARFFGKKLLNIQCIFWFS